MKELIKDVEQWGRDKGILDKATVLTQFEKMIEETMELNEEIKSLYSGNLNSMDNLHMELGDVVVTAVILAKLAGTDIQTVLQKAYDKISKRTGKMINGTFYKSEDIDKDGKPKR